MSALEQTVLTVLHIEYYAMKTEKAYLHWIRRFVAYHSGKRPSDMSGHKSTSSSVTWPSMSVWLPSPEQMNRGISNNVVVS